jgi:hypothetical protein
VDYNNDSTDRKLSSTPTLPWHAYLPYQGHTVLLQFLLSDAGGHVSCRITVVQPDGRAYAETAHASGPTADCVVTMDDFLGNGWSLLG